MSQTQRYTSRTAGRVERREAPAPYTPTKPAPKPKKNSSSFWDYIKSWSFFGSSKDMANEEPEPTPEPSSPADAPPSFQDVITRHRTASPNLQDTQEAIVAMQAKATKNLYERGLELQREHDEMIQETAPPPSTSPSEPAEEEKPVPKVYHMPFYREPGTKEWFIQGINNHPGNYPTLKVANYLMSKKYSKEPTSDVEFSAIREILQSDPSSRKVVPPAPASIPVAPKRQPTGKEILARIQPKEPEIPVFVDEWITKPKWEYCPPADDIWDGVIYHTRPRDIPEGMEYRTLLGGRGYLAKKRPAGFWNVGPPPQPTASTSKRPRLGDAGLPASTSVSTSLGLPTDPELFVPRTSTSKPPPPPLISTGRTKPLAESQKTEEVPKKEAPLKKSQTYKAMQEIVVEEAAKKAAEEKERQMKELIEKAMIALDGGAGRPPIRRDRPILRYPDPQGSKKKSSAKKNQPKKDPAKKIPTVNDILDIHTGRADPSQFDASAADASSVTMSQAPAMKPYEPTPRKRSPKRSLEDHQQEHGEIETAETSPKKKVKTNGVMLATHVQATSGSGAAAEDAIVIDDVDEEMDNTRALVPTVPITTPAPVPTVSALTPAPAPAPVPAPAPALAPAPAQTSLVPPPPCKPRAIPTLPPVNPLAPPYVRAFSPSRPSPLRMVSSVDSPEGSPHPTAFSVFNAKPKPEPEVIDIDAEEDQLAEDDNQKTPIPTPTPTVMAPSAPAPVFKPTPASARFAQSAPQPVVNSWPISTSKDTPPVLPASPKTTARNAPADSLPDYSKGLSGIPLCHDVVMGEPEAQTIARTVSEDELPVFEIDLGPMFDPTPWIEKKNTAPPVPTVPSSTQASAPMGQTQKCPAPVKPFNWAAAGLKRSTPVTGEWTCSLCSCKTKDTLSKCSVCEAPKPGAAAATPTPAPAAMSPTMPELIPEPTPAKAAPVGFNWAAAGLKLPTKAAGTWTCSTCSIDNKPEADKCISCDAPKPGSVTAPAPLTNGFKLPPPILSNGFSWGIPPSSIVASKPAINGK